MTGQGGWPMTCVLDPDGTPFFAGTYFPDQPRHGSPSLPAGPGGARPTPGATAATTYARSAGAIARAPAGTRRGGRRGPHRRRRCSPRRGATGWRASSTARYGGFGGAPKFPPSMVLEFLLRHHAARGPPRIRGQRVARCWTRPARRWPAAASTTSSAAGFARYSVDAALGGAALREDALRQRPAARRLRPLGRADWRTGSRRGDRRLPARASCAPPRAASPPRWTPTARAVEGTFYAWTPEQLRRGARRRTTAPGPPTSFDGHRGRHLRARLLDAPAARRPRRPRAATTTCGGGCSPPASDRVRPGPRRQGGRRLERPGDQRPRATPARCFDRPELVAAAVEAAELLVARAPGAGAGSRVSRDGVAGRHAGVLEDHGCVAEGFLALSPATGEARWLEHAGGCSTTPWPASAAEDGGFYDTADDAEALIARARGTPPTTPARPASPRRCTRCATYAALTGSRPAPAGGGAGAGRDGAGARRRRPRGSPAGRWPPPRRCSTARTRSPWSADPGAEARDALAARRPAPSPVRWCVVADARPRRRAAAGGPRRGRRPPAAYVCRDLVCERPVTDPEALSPGGRARAGLPPVGGRATLTGWSCRLGASPTTSPTARPRRPPPAPVRRRSVRRRGRVPGRGPGERRPSRSGGCSSTAGTGGGRSRSRCSSSSNRSATTTGSSAPPSPSRPPGASSAPT